VLVHESSIVKGPQLVAFLEVFIERKVRVSDHVVENWADITVQLSQEFNSLLRVRNEPI
jgi:hypothetical protein